MSEPMHPRDIDALVRRLPHAEPGAERSLAMRRAVLAAAASEPAPQPRLRYWATALVAAAAAAACIVLPLRAAGRHPVAVGSTATAVATAAPPPGADAIVEGVTTYATTELVRLRRGSTTITAPPGARFDVEVRGDHVTSVAVRVGWAVLESAQRAATTINERQTWTLAGATTAPAPSPASSVAPAAGASAGSAAGASAGSAAGASAGSAAGASAGSGHVSAPPAPAPAAVAAHPAAPPPPDRAPTRRAAAASPTAPVASVEAVADPAAPERAEPAAGPAVRAERAFRDGLRTLLAGDARGAIGMLDRACGAASSSQDDSCYWAAVARLRSGDRSGAREAYRHLLSRWPSTVHVGEANVAFGWLLLEAGDRVAARMRFAAASSDAMPSVRADALRGLAAAQ